MSLRLAKLWRALCLENYVADQNAKSPPRFGIRRLSLKNSTPCPRVPSPYPLTRLVHLQTRNIRWQRRGRDFEWRKRRSKDRIRRLSWAGFLKLFSPGCEDTVLPTVTIPSLQVPICEGRFAGVSARCSDGVSAERMVAAGERCPQPAVGGPKTGQLCDFSSSAMACPCSFSLA